MGLNVHTRGGYLLPAMTSSGQENIPGQDISMFSFGKRIVTCTYIPKKCVHLRVIVMYSHTHILELDAAEYTDGMKSEDFPIEIMILMGFKKIVKVPVVCSLLPSS